MRKWHRWISVFFGVFMLWIAGTGVLSQIGSLVNRGGFETAEGERRGPPGGGPGAPAAIPGAPAGFVCPEALTCRPKPVPKPGQWNVGLLHHLHSGESFGPVGTIISILSGLALLFFAVSGLWMYITMFRARARKEHHRGGRFFW